MVSTASSPSFLLRELRVPSPTHARFSCHRSPLRNGNSSALIRRSSLLPSSTRVKDASCVEQKRRTALTVNSTPEPAAGSVGNLERVWSLPVSIDDSIDQAASSCVRAIRDGNTFLSLEILLPLIGPSMLDDWPGGVRQQYKAAEPLIASLLKQLSTSEVLSGNVPVGTDGTDAEERRFGGCSRRVLDDDDVVVAWEGEKLALVLFPTAETMNQIIQIAEKGAKGEKSRPFLLVNPQWQPGQVVSDFGFGRSRQIATEFLNRFVEVYSLKRNRIRSRDVQVFRCYPSKYQVFVGPLNPSDAPSAEGGAYVSSESEKPSYKRLEELIREKEREESGGSGGGGGWLDRIKAELQFNQKTMK